MKVLKKGEGWSKTCKCSGSGNGGGGCKAELLVEKGDLFLTGRSFIDGSSETYVTFECPECKILTDIEGVPYAITSKLSKRYPGGRDAWD